MTKNAAEKAVRNKEVELEADFHKKALVIGGGIAGIQTALDVANAGFPVVLVEKEPTIGGHMAQLGKIFPSMDLATHILTPLMNEVWHHQNIRLLTSSEVVGVKGHLGNFHLRIKKNPRFVDLDKCDLCQKRGSVQCVEVCPVTVLSEFDEGLTLRKAIYIPFPQVVPSTYTIDQDVCILCGKCAQPDVCPPGAVNLADEEEIIEEDVGVVIVATGYELYSQENVEKYGVDECSDVITSLQFERLLSPEGPTAGVPMRPSDGKIPKKLAFIDCTESKDGKHLPYYGNINYTYLAKQAILFKKAVPNSEVYSFGVDVSVVGKGYQDFIKRAQKEAGTNYILAEVSRISEQEGKVKIRGIDNVKRRSMEMEVDMAVLALPMIPSLGIEDLANQMQIEINEYGFPRKKHSTSRLTESATSGILIAGCALTPMDIQSTVAQASAAANEALGVLTQIERASQGM